MGLAQLHRDLAVAGMARLRAGSRVFRERSSQVLHQNEDPLCVGKLLFLSLIASSKSSTDGVEADPVFPPSDPISRK